MFGDIFVRTPLARKRKVTNAFNKNAFVTILCDEQNSLPQKQNYHYSKCKQNQRGGMFPYNFLYLIELWPVELLLCAQCLSLTLFPTTHQYLLEKLLKMGQERPLSHCVKEL